MFKVFIGRPGMWVISSASCFILFSLLHDPWPWSKVAVNLFTLDKTDYMIIVDDNSSFFGVRALFDTRASSVIIRKSKIIVCQAWHPQHCHE